MGFKTFFATLAVAGFSYSAQASCPVGTKAYHKNLNNKETCALYGTYKDDLFLSSDKSWVLEGGVFIGKDNGQGGTNLELDPAVLTIEAGTTIYALNPKKDMSLPPAAQKDRKDFLVISRGSQIIAEGTESSPIVFTSASDAPKAADWGGLFIDGMAPVNKCADLNNCSVAGEAGTGWYGGNDPFDNSGVLRYVRVEFGGDQIDEEKQFNGITFNSVGAGTIVDYIQVHKNDDDGIEFFGGTVNVKHVVITEASDDSIDWTYGYTGMIQFAAVVQGEAKADRGIEADNNSKNVDLEPRSNPTLSNVTLLGSSISSEGLKFRVGTAVTMTNSIVMGFAKNCMDDKDAYAPGVHVFNNVFACANLGTSANHAGNEFYNDKSIVKLDGLFPATGSDLLVKGSIPEDFDFFFDDVSFIGAFGDTNWAANWTVGL
ncbi:MAG: hypothetical protein KDD58_10820 [Bdellovibrionales bacterium]|nr:hypothetical protein [Bdellovibrionales bacterium]